MATPMVEYKVMIRVHPPLELRHFYFVIPTLARVLSLSTATMSKISSTLRGHFAFIRRLDQHKDID